MTYKSSSSIIDQSFAHRFDFAAPRTRSNRRDVFLLAAIRLTKMSGNVGDRGQNGNRTGGFAAYFSVLVVFGILETPRAWITDQSRRLATFAFQHAIVRSHWIVASRRTQKISHFGRDTKFRRDR